MTQFPKYEIASFRVTGRDGTGFVVADLPPADSQVGVKMHIREACQLLRQLGPLLCFEC